MRRFCPCPLLLFLIATTGQADSVEVGPAHLRVPCARAEEPLRFAPKVPEHGRWSMRSGSAIDRGIYPDIPGFGRRPPPPHPWLPAVIHRVAANTGAWDLQAVLEMARIDHLSFRSTGISVETLDKQNRVKWTCQVELAMYETGRFVTIVTRIRGRSSLGSAPAEVRGILDSIRLRKRL